MIYPLNSTVFYKFIFTFSWKSLSGVDKHTALQAYIFIIIDAGGFGDFKTRVHTWGDVGSLN